MLIHTRERNKVNLAAGDPLLDKRERIPKNRPISAPITKDEAESAYISASETDDAIPFNNPIRSFYKVISTNFLTHNKYVVT